MNLSKLSAASTIRWRVAVSAVLIGTVLPAAAHAQMAAPVTDPIELGVMQGFPPPADKLVTKANSLRFPNLGWALRNTRMMMPTTNVEHARVPMPLPVVSTLDPDKVQFTVDGTTLSLSDYLRRTYTDGFIVIHDGKIVYEGYFNSYTPHQTHAWASMTKSVTGLIATQLIDEGKLNPEAKLSAYVPELAGTAFGDATVQQNLDMEVPVSYPADLPPDLGLFGAVGFIPRRSDAPDSIYDFLKVTHPTPNATAGAMWYYQNGSPEAVAWALRRITGLSWSEMVSRSIWQKIAADDGDVVVDRTGTEMASGGLNTTLRDAARFGELMRKGAVGASTLVPVSSIRLALKPTDNAGAFAKGNLAAGHPGYSYHDYWYQVNDGDRSFSAGGRFGQSILVNPKAGITIVKFSSYPDQAARPTSAAAGNAIPRAPLATAEALDAAARAIKAALGS
jgi:CubicO group peptidase (beta-lactamase class C family)